MGLAAQNALGSYAYLQNYNGSTNNNLRQQTSINGRTDSDIRLKTNITKIGEQNGINLYTWDWNDIAKARGVNSPTIGVIAQEVDPAFVTEKDGYLQVDYSGLFSEETI